MGVAERPSESAFFLEKGMTGLTLRGLFPFEPFLFFFSFSSIFAWESLMTTASAPGGATRTPPLLRWGVQHSRSEVSQLLRKCNQDLAVSASNNYVASATSRKLF